MLHGRKWEKGVGQASRGQRWLSAPWTSEETGQCQAAPVTRLALSPASRCCLASTHQAAGQGLLGQQERSEVLEQLGPVLEHSLQAPEEIHSCPPLRA